MLYSSLQLIDLFAVAASAVILYRFFSSPRKDLSEPPGPRPLLFLGNLLDLPREPLHIGYTRLAERYGPIMKFSTPTNTIVVLSNAKVVVDLLEKRGSIYSNRPDLHMARLSGWEWNMVLLNNGPALRARRRIVLHHLGQNANHRHVGQQTRIALQFVQSLMESPDNFVAHGKRVSAANILRTTYGIDVALDNDSFVKLGDDASDAWCEVIRPGVWAIDLIPILKYLPDWCPGAYFKKFAQEKRKYATDMMELPFARARRDMEKETAISCMVTEELSLASNESNVRIVQEAAGVMYLGGADTTSTTLHSFFLAMTMNPDICRAAQQQLDHVIGPDKLPTFADRAALSYIEAIVREVYRMYPTVSMAAHALEQNDVYKGMYLRKGTIVIANIWAILHDPLLYPDPYTFKPERFMRDGQIDEKIPDPREHIFGYGRRICPGQYFADASIFICVALVLYCFNISRKVENGVEVSPSGELQHGTLIVPFPFKCHISPRSTNIASLIAQSLEETTA